MSARAATGRGRGAGRDSGTDRAAAGLQLRAPGAGAGTLGWRYRDLDPELRKSFEVALHAGGALALLIGLRDEVADYVRSFGPDNLVNLALSFAPAALAALAFERPIERRLGEPGPVAVALIAGSVAMAAADGFPQERDRDQATAADALAIGFAQACALVPGVSRNGATLTAARVLRFRRPDANVISRQIALPVILGAAALKGVRLARRGLPPGVAAGWSPEPERRSPRPSCRCA